METGAKEPEKQEENKRVREGIVSRQEVSTGPNAAQGSSEMGPAKLSVGFSSNEGIGDFVKNGLGRKMWSEARLQWITRRGDI